MEIYKVLQKEFYGDDTRWFLGIVEDNKNDPEKLGRVRVRVYGAHNAYLSEVPTELLPWATVMVPATYGGVSGVGRSPTGIEQGSWVFGIFLDGKHSQNPLVMGTIGKIEQTPGEDITPEDKIGPTSIKSNIGGAGDTTNATNVGGIVYANTSTGQIAFEVAKQEGFTEISAAAIAGASYAP
tara:strand:- start:509 stop:1054 length:546 start_codon:yes stop_codon:yes gene_type:complete